jgi:hypothetical protein
MEPAHNNPWTGSACGLTQLGASQNRAGMPLMLGGPKFGHGRNVDRQPKLRASW